jgi:hypothetical protein
VRLSGAGRMCDQRDRLALSPECLKRCESFTLMTVERHLSGLLERKEVTLFQCSPGPRIY